MIHFTSGPSGEPVMPKHSRSERRSRSVRMPSTPFAYARDLSVKVTSPGTIPPLDFDLCALALSPADRYTIPWRTRRPPSPTRPPKSRMLCTRLRWMRRGAMSSVRNVPSARSCAPSAATPFTRHL